MPSDVPVDVRQHVAKRIREIREEANLLQATMAERLNIDPRTYAAYESGDRNFELKTLERIAAALPGTRVADFFMPAGERSSMAIALREQGVSPERVRKARELLGLTQAQLAGSSPSLPTRSLVGSADNTRSPRWYAGDLSGYSSQAKR